MKMNIVLCPIDFSQLAEREIALSVELCRTFGARLVLHHNLAAGAPGFAKAWEWDEAHRQERGSTHEAERKMQQLLRRVPPAVEAEASISRGPLATVLLSLARELPADLVVLGSHGWSTQDHASVTERIVERSPCPVLTFGEDERNPMQRLTANGSAKRAAVLTDLGENGNRAVDYAFRIARRLPLQLHLVHVGTGRRAESAKKTLGDLIPPDLAGRAECHVRIGRPGEEIESFLRQIDADLAVMGTHARDFWRGLFTHDTARELLHRAGCPVWFVPPQG